MEEKNLGIEALTQPNLQFQEINKMWGHKEYKSLLRVCCGFFPGQIMSYQPIFLLWWHYVDGRGRCDFHFAISKAFYIISDYILISQGKKSTMMCQQSCLKRHTCKSCQGFADKKKKHNLSSEFWIKSLLDQTLQPWKTKP